MPTKSKKKSAAQKKVGRPKNAKTEKAVSSGLRLQIPPKKLWANIRAFLSSPKEFFSKKVGITDFVSLIIAIILISFVAGLIFSPLQAYSYVHSRALSQMQQNFFLTGNTTYNSTAMDIAASQKTNEYFSGLSFIGWAFWAAILMILALTAAIFSLASIAVKAAVRWLWLKFWGGGADYASQIVLDSYLYIIITPLETAFAIALVAGVLLKADWLFIIALFSFVPLELFNWVYYVRGNSAIHSMPKSKTFWALFIPIILVILLVAILIIVTASIIAYFSAHGAIGSANVSQATANVIRLLR